MRNIIKKDEFGREYVIKIAEIERILRESEKRIESGLGGGQPNLILGCFKGIDYDFERCKSCRFYEWKCKLVLGGFIEKKDLFRK